tara:strand:- start:764 stop:1012 length:249 start_codon:yes stop_codon:yes gene_type:complete
MTKAQAIKIKLPGYIVRDCWEGFVEMRYSIKRPLTERSCKLILNKLKRIDEATANEILDQSTMNCWQGIYPVKEDNENSDWG